MVKNTKTAKITMQTTPATHMPAINLALDGLDPEGEENSLFITTAVRNIYLASFLLHDLCLLEYRLLEKPL